MILHKLRCECAGLYVTLYNFIIIGLKGNFNLAARSVAKVEERLSQEELKLILDKYKLLFDMED